MRFDLTPPRRVLFGPDRLDELGDEAARLGTRALLVTGADPRRAAPARALLEEAGLVIDELGVAGEPTVAVVEEGAARARAAGCDLVVSVGGGSALDAGKAIAGLAPAPGPPRRYLEVVGEARPLEAAPLPQVAVPTTAGTGSEATRNAVLGVPEEGVKVSLRDPALLPAVALVDPQLTRSAPPAVTAASGLDALTQLLEPFVSVRANPVTDAFCREGLPRAMRALPRALADGEDLAARTDLSLASLLSGMALANAGLGAVHGLAGPLGGLRPAPHGAVCGRLLPVATEVNVRALRARDPDGVALARYAEAAELLVGRADCDALVAALHELVDEAGVPGLASHGVLADDLPRIVAASWRASSMRGNPVELTDEERTEVLRRAL